MGIRLVELRRRKCHFVFWLANPRHPSQSSFAAETVAPRIAYAKNRQFIQDLISLLEAVEKLLGGGVRSAIQIDGGLDVAQEERMFERDLKIGRSLGVAVE